MTRGNTISSRAVPMSSRKFWSVGRVLSALATGTVLLGGQPAAQETVPHVLHQFTSGTTPYEPSGIVSAIDGGALVVGGGCCSNSITRLVARVSATGPISLLRSFEREPAPERLVRGGDGHFYGVICGGGPSNLGSVVRIDASGGLTTAYLFRAANDGYCPGDLFPGPDGAFWGSAYSAVPGMHSVFTVSSEGVVTPAVFTTSASVVAVGPDGSVYGVDQSGIVRRAPSGEVTLVADPLSDVWAVLPLLDGTVLAMTSPGADVSRCDLVRIASGTVTALHAFPEACAVSSLRGRWHLLQAERDSNGAVGFTTRTVFRVRESGTVTTVPRSPDSPAETNHIQDLDRSADGALWGVTTRGPFGGGTVFRVSSTGVWTTVAALPAGNEQGAFPTGPLVADADGFVYGTAVNGGLYDKGTVYRVSKDGRRFDLLHTFTGGSDGEYPNALVRTREGHLYGTTPSGANHGGTVFHIGRTGALTTLFAFSRIEDGGRPSALIVGSDGALYGRTYDHGQFASGTAFRWSPLSGFSTLHHFSPADRLAGQLRSNAPFVAGIDGHLYGLTGACTPFDCGQNASVFRMTLRGDVTPVWTTDALREPLVQTRDGMLWGTAGSGQRLFSANPAGGGRFVGTGPDVTVATVSADGVLFGFGAQRISANLIEDFVVKIHQTGEARRNGSSWPFRHRFRASGTVVDGRDGFLYGTFDADEWPRGLGTIFRVVPLGPSAPPNLRIVR